MSNRIEEAIQKIIFTRKQQDVLLERIIKQSLLLEDAPRKITIKALSQKQLAYAQSQGAEYAFQIVTKDIVSPESNMNSWVQKVIVKSDEDTRDRVAIGPSSKFAKGTTAYNLNLNDPKSTVDLPNYIYLVRGPFKKQTSGDDEPEFTKKYLRKTKKLDNDSTVKGGIGSFKLSVWIIPLSVYGPLLQYKGKYSGINYKINFIKLGDAPVMDDNDFKVLLTQRLTKIAPGTAGDLAQAPASWGRDMNSPQLSFEGGPPPQNWIEYINRGLGLGASKTIKVTDKELGSGKFTGDWDDYLELPVQGVWTGDNGTIADGTFSSSPAEDIWWLSDGTITYSDGEIQKGLFNRNMRLNGKGSYKLADGTTFEGELTDGKRVTGKLTSPNGQTKFGTWDQNDDFLSGKITYSDGSTESGTFKNGVAIYYKKFTDANGKTIESSTQCNYDSDGKIDTSKNGYIENKDDSGNVLAYYVGTLNQNLTPLNGTQYTSSDKTTVMGTFTNGVWKKK